MSALLPACERAVRTARRAGADAAEVFALLDRGGSVDLEKGDVVAAEWAETLGFGVRLVKGGRVGFAYASVEDRVPEAVQAALRAARLGKPLPKFRFPSPRRAPRVAGLYDPRVASLGGEELLGYAGELLDAVMGVRKDLLVAGGGVHLGLTESAVANSEGLERHSRETGLGGSLYVVQRRDGVSTGFASAESTRADMRWDRIGREAGELAVRSSKPALLEKGRTLSCIVRPDSAADLLGTVTVPSLYGKPARRGESYYSGKIGKRVMHAKLHLVDDATVPRGLGSAAYDDEGVPTAPRKLIASGVLKSFLFDHYDAAEHGDKATGNAVRIHPFDGRSYKSPPTTSALQIRVVAPQTTTEKLVASVDDGLLLHDMMGVHTANAVSGDFSVTSSVLFRIRKGAIEGPVAPLSVAGNVHKSLVKGLRLGDDAKPIGGSPAWNLPSVLFEGFTVTP
jgi:PmbA protein